MRLGIENCQPETFMTDFELRIINAFKQVFSHKATSACFFHLYHNLFRKIQSEGLQISYNSAEDRSIKEFTHIYLQRWLSSP